MRAFSSNRPLTTRHLDKVYQELDEVAVAVSLVGTRKEMIEKLAALVDPIAEALVGIRPRVVAARGELQRSTHNARRTRTTAREASDAIWDMARAVKNAKVLVKRKGLGDVPSVTGAGEFSILNVWGYNAKEMASLKQELHSVSSILVAAGLEDAAGTVVLDEKRARRDAFRYDGKGDFVADARRASRGNEVLEAVARRVWLDLFEKRHRELWRGEEAFVDAFIAQARKERQSDDIEARLRATVGRIASKRWAA